MREKLSSRLGFILLSAGCAIGLGNVWRFPYITGLYGGGIFVIFYFTFLVIMGLPILAMEFSNGRASKKSIVKSYQVLEQPNQKWHLHGGVALCGNIILMMFYTTVAGWLLYYFVRFISGGFASISVGDEVANTFVAGTMSNPSVSFIWMALSLIIAIGICSFGLKNGVEKITKIMMVCLLALMVILVFYCISLPNAIEGLKFYLLPDVDRAMEIGLGTVIIEAMNQAFFTLSLGIGAMSIFGSYLDDKRSLLGESVRVIALDTFVALTAGLIIFPACFAFNVSPDSGPPLIFITLPNVFLSMKGGLIWGTLFFLFMSFAALSTVIAVCENIIACLMDMFSFTRKKACVITLVSLIILATPCALGYSLLAHIEPLGAGTSILDLEDFIVSQLLLPLGSLVILIFSTSTKYGWGFDKFKAEANKGIGLKVKDWSRVYLTYILPVVILFIFIYGLIAKFA